MNAADQGTATTTESIIFSQVSCCYTHAIKLLILDFTFMHSIKFILAFIALLTPLVGCHEKAEKYQGLAERAVISPATVNGTACENHGSVSYSYVINGKRYYGWTSNAELSLSSCSDIRPGHAFSIYYDPLHPSVNSIKEPWEEYERRRGYYIPGWLIYFLPLFIPFFVLGIEVLKDKQNDTGAPTHGDR
ncbi:hypothetical protein [Janthinobacterium tructae]